MYNRVCLFGAGGHGRVVAQQIRARWPDTDLCFGDMQKIRGTDINGICVTYNKPEEMKEGYLIITIGNNTVRARIQGLAIDSGIPLGHFIANPDHFFALSPGDGSMILAGAIVTSDVKIGAGVIVNSGAIIEHDSVIGDFCHLAPGSVLAGGSVLGKRVFLGAGAQVVNQASIADDTIIGAGATVVQTIEEPGIYIGSPAKLIGTV
ncbi:MAG: NeuD/PglB/VioB family sugar acetyltransferase [Gammaproteobacteria bacterium]|nr:NeuD/PglB/VioB family sugar acetyltransferase [Gammaproteobacteria bacterium]